MAKFFFGLGVGIVIGAVMVVFSEQAEQEEYSTIRWYHGVPDDAREQYPPGVLLETSGLF